MSKKNEDRRPPRNTMIAGRRYTLALFRVVDVRGEKVLKLVADDEEVQLKKDPSLNVFVTSYVLTTTLRSLGARLVGPKEGE